MRWMPDEVDRWCMQWAQQRRRMLGIDQLEPQDRLGKLSGTLGAVREDAEGASQGTTHQTFPEVYTGTSLLVHRAICEMNPKWALVISTHFVLKEIKVKAKAHRIGLDVAAYWKTFGQAKSYVHSFVTICTKYEGKTGKVMETHQLPRITEPNALAGR